MNRKTHSIAGLILSGAVYFVTGNLLASGLTWIGSLANDLDYAGVPGAGRNYHRKLFHNIWIPTILIFIAQFRLIELRYMAFGMMLHNFMDIWSRSPIYWVWPVDRDPKLACGGWGVKNRSILSPVVGLVAALIYTGGYLAFTGNLEVLEWILGQVF